MKFKSLYLLLFLILFNNSHVVFADKGQDDEQVDRHEQLQQALEDKFTKAVETKNKAQILGYIKQDPSYMFSFAEYDDFLDNPDKTIRMFTTMKKAGVNLNYQNEDGESILHVTFEVLLMQALYIPIIGALFNNIGNAINQFFVGNQDEDEQNQEGSFLSESELILNIQNTQKIVKALCKLGVKKHLKTREDRQTAADYVKEFIDEMEDEFDEHAQVVKELQNLYKMLK